MNNMISTRKIYCFFSFIFFISLPFCFSNPKFSKVVKDTTVITINNSTGKCFIKDSIGAFFRFNNYKRWIPQYSELFKADSLMVHFILDSIKDHPRITNCIYSYKRQYVGIVNENSDSLIFINCFLESKKSKFPEWINVIIEADDGGDFYFQVLIDIRKSKLKLIDINH